MRIEYGIEDGARYAPMLNTLKNARRNMTHLAKSAQVRYSGTPANSQYIQVMAPTTVERAKPTVRPMVVR